MCVTCFKALNHLVSVHRMLAYVDDTDGNVGAMVTHTLKVGDEIRPNKSGFDGARAFLKSCDVVITEKRFQIVDHLFKRLNVVCKRDIVTYKRPQMRASASKMSNIDFPPFYMYEPQKLRYFIITCIIITFTDFTVSRLYINLTLQVYINLTRTERKYGGWNFSALV